MRPSFRVLTLAAALLALTLPTQAQTREGLMGDLLKDIDGLQTKIVGLAKAMPPASYEWRPGKGVRSTGEVFMHVAADNYFMPAAMGTNPPAETGIVGEGLQDDASVRAEEGDAGADRRGTRQVVRFSEVVDVEYA